MKPLFGLHHITTITGDAQQNFEFYTRVLGLRLVKKTVNFDDPLLIIFITAPSTARWARS